MFCFTDLFRLKYDVKWLHMYELAKVSLNKRGNEIKSVERKSGELRLSNPQTDDNRVHAAGPAEQFDQEVVENELNENDVGHSAE